MKGDIQFLIECITFLLGQGLNRGALTPEICRGIVDLASHCSIIDNDVRFSLDCCSEDGQEWWIQASTDLRTSPETRYPAGRGLTGWVLQKKRRLLYESEQRYFPEDIQFVSGYEATESVFIQLLRIDGRPSGCICVVSNNKSAIKPAKADIFFKLGKSIETLVSKSRDWKPSSRFQGDLPPARVDEVAIIEWLRKRFPTHYRWAYFWKWEDRHQHLAPIPLTSEILSLKKTWLKPLKLGEGFVGSCAVNLETIVEQEVNEGRGRKSGIESPLTELKPGVSVRSVLVTPVRDREKLYGVLAILGESANLFHEDDAIEIESLARELSHQFRQADDMVIAETQRSVRDRLLDCLREPLRPTEYWNKLSEALDILCKGGICNSAALLVAKRSERRFFTRKSFAPLKARYDRLVINIGDDPLFDSLIRRSDLPRLIDRLPKEGILRQLVPVPTQQVERVWLNAYALDQASANPTLVCIVGFPNRTSLSAPFGTRPLEYAISEAVAEVFAVTRAILAAADLGDLSRRQAWLMTAETHDILQPLSTIKHSAESLTVESAEDMDRVRRILSAVEELLTRRENILFRSLTGESGEFTREEISEHIDVFKLWQEIVSDFLRQRPGQQITLRGGQDQANFFVTGYRRWLLVAFRNVLDNAVKFGNNSPVLVTLKMHIESRQSMEERYVLVMVQDHGIGIPEAELQSIFRAGHRNEYSRRYEATGSQIALSVTKEIVEAHKGSIWATSVLKRGSIFYIKIPWSGEEV